MDMNAAFPSKYLKASDLQDREVTAPMDEVRIESIGSDDKEELKHVLYFIGGKKGLVLNKTNANAIIEQYGVDSDTWHSRPITLFPTQTDYGGKIVPCIRVKLNIKPRPQAQPQPQAQPAETQQPGDDIPF